MKGRYNRLACAIIAEAEERKVDIRDVIREWVKIIELTRVVGWNRGEFLDEITKVKSERAKIEKTL